MRHLRALCAIADAGSLHQAARQLGVAQPTLSTQLSRIEQALGGQLFVRERSGCRPTPLGRTVLGRARPLLADMRTLVREARAAAAGGDSRLRVGSTASRALAGWLRRLRHPGLEPTLQMDVSANALLRRVGDGQLDVAFVHEVEGCPLRVPEGLRLRVLIEREPQFVMLPADHPAAARPVVHLTDLADDRWMVDPTVDGEWDGVHRMLRAVGLDPRVLHGDYHTAASLVATGEVVTVCQPSSQSAPTWWSGPCTATPSACACCWPPAPGPNWTRSTPRSRRRTGRWPASPPSTASGWRAPGRTPWPRAHRRPERGPTGRSSFPPAEPDHPAIQVLSVPNRYDNRAKRLRRGA
ncbi:hypothetical protein SHO565_71430 [Streptomyces sp. HO565]